MRLVGAHLDREIIDACRKTNHHSMFEKDFPLLMHGDDILSNRAEVNIPWKVFTFGQE